MKLWCIGRHRATNAAVARVWERGRNDREEDWIAAGLAGSPPATKKKMKKKTKKKKKKIRAEDQVQPNGAHEVVREWAVDRQHLAAFEDMNARGKRALQALGM